MYSLDCEYYDYKSHSLEGLLENIMETGMDPNYEVTFNGKGLGETAWQLMGEEN